MALSELAALDAAYQTLRPLDPAARRRALQWLADALAAEPPRTPTTASTSSVAAPAAATDLRSTTAATTRSNPTKPAKRTARQPARRATTATVAAPQAATSSRTRGARATRTAAGTARRTQAPARQQARPYRRMPPADEVMAAYNQIGSVSGLAEHFNVPGHTAQGWARQLRRHGYAIGQNR
jgi:hypothetical protein